MVRRSRGNRDAVEKGREGKAIRCCTAGPGRLRFLSSIFVVGVLVQVFFAGMGAFGADWSYHVTFVHFLGPLPLLMVLVAFVGRLSWG